MSGRAPERPGAAAAFLPSHLDLGSLREAAAGCRACPLWERGTQTVFGEGPATARVVLVGEQPGDREDVEGHPFVGPAGRLLDEALAGAGIDRATVYVTNAVKHFKWVAKGKRRIHQAPAASEIAACRPWLESEVAVVAPRVIVALGATAGRSLLGPAFRVTRDRGRFAPRPQGGEVMGTVHPSAILRMDPAHREIEMAAFVDDLARVPPRLAG